jgi:hypothetical protein
LQDIFEVLTSTTHNGFPVVSNSGSKYRGTIIRNHLIVLLRRQMWSGSEQDILAGKARCWLVG